MSYLLLKWLHVLAAIAIVGTHFTYGFWIVRGSSRPEALPFILRNVKWLDQRISTGAYVVLLLTGFTMGRSMLTVPWLLSALILLALLMLAHVTLYGPVVRRLIRLLDSDGSESPAYQAAAHREARVGVGMVLLMAVIVFLMVVKPALWS